MTIIGSVAAPEWERLTGWDQGPPIDWAKEEGTRRNAEPETRVNTIRWRKAFIKTIPARGLIDDFKLRNFNWRLTTAARRKNYC
jgi:hypothetical protein